MSRFSSVKSVENYQRMLWFVQAAHRQIKETNDRFNQLPDKFNGIWR